MIRAGGLLLAIGVLAGCAGGGVRVYPPEPADPADAWPRGWAGPDCSPASPVQRREVTVGSGDPVRPFTQVTVRVTVEDTKPPAATHGPVMVTFVYPPIEKFPYRGRNWDLTTTIFADGVDNAGFFARSEAAMLGGNVVGMRMGGTRKATESFVGKLGTLELPPGQPRHFTLTLVQVCYPELWAESRLRWSWADGSGSPLNTVPSVTIKGCGHQ